MTLSPLARHRLDRVLLVLTALAVLALLMTATDAVAGVGGPQLLVRVICAGFLVARIVPWLKRHYAAHRETVAGLSTLAAFIAAIFLLTHPAMEEPTRILGGLVVLFGIPALVAWKLNPASFRDIWLDYRAKSPRPTDAR